MEILQPLLHENFTAISCMKIVQPFPA